MEMTSHLIRFFNSKGALTLLIQLAIQESPKVVTPGEEKNAAEKETTDMETQEAKKIVEALTAADNQTCKQIDIITVLTRCNFAIWLEPFPSYGNSAADDFEHILSKYRKSL